jgi:cell division protein FtsL
MSKNIGMSFVIIVLLLLICYLALSVKYEKQMVETWKKGYNLTVSSLQKDLELSQTECSLLKDLRRIDEKMNKLEMELKDKEIKTLKDMISILGYLSQINNFIPDKIDPNSMSKI